MYNKLLLYRRPAMFVLAVLLLMLSCQKNDHQSTSSQFETFDVSASKEWWYGTFRKKADYKYLDDKSLFAPSSTKDLKRWPDWKKGISYKVKGLEIVEMPLVYAVRKILFPSTGAISQDEQVRIARASLYKLLLAKKTDGTIVTRTITLVPTPEYAKSKNYDISGSTLQKIDPAFSGWMIVKDWNQTLIHYWQIEQGKIRKELKSIRKAEASSGSVLPSVNSTSQPVSVNSSCLLGYIDIEVGSFCVGYTMGGGDIPPNENDCDNWIPVYSSVPVYGDCGDEGDPEGDPCSTYGIGCGGGSGGGGGGSSNGSTEIFNEVVEPCLRQTVDEVMDADCGNAITAAIHQMFGIATEFDITFGERPMGNLINVDDGLTEISFFPATPADPIPSLQAHVYLNNSPGSLPAASYEYIVATILHESLHAWIQALAPTNPTTGSNAVSHETMTSPDNISMLAGAIQAMCPNVTTQDAVDLAWGGLQHTTGPTGWTSLSPATRSRIQQTNAEHRNRTRGTTPCTP